MHTRSAVSVHILWMLAATLGLNATKPPSLHRRFRPSIHLNIIQAAARAANSWRGCGAGADAMVNGLSDPSESVPVRIVPLGGLVEIGLNLMVIECGSHAIIIDAGVLFPEERELGIGLIM